MRAPRKLHALAGTLLIPAALLAGCGMNPDAPGGATGSTGQQVAQAQQAATAVLAPTASVPEPTIPDAVTSSTDILATPPPMPTRGSSAPTAVIPPAPEPALAVQGTGAVTRNTFDNASERSNWTVIDAVDYAMYPQRSTWEIQDGLLSQRGDENGGTGQYGTALVTGDATARNYQVSAAVFSTGNEEAGVVVRASERGYYVFRLLANDIGQPTRVLSRYNPATQQYTDLAQAEGPGLEERTWAQLSVQVQGDRIQAFVNGQPAVQATDSTLTQGGTGVYGYAQGGLKFDNVAVQALPDSQ